MSAPGYVRTWQHRCDDGVGGCTAISETFRGELVRLLHHVDGQLGLAVYRGEGGQERWKKEADALISKLRDAVKGLEETDHE